MQTSLGKKIRNKDEQTDTQTNRYVKDGEEFLVDKRLDSVVEFKGRNAKTKKRNEIKYKILVDKLYGKRPFSWPIDGRYGRVTLKFMMAKFVVQVWTEKNGPQ